MTKDLVYVFDKKTKASSLLGEIQTGFNMSLVNDGTKDSMKIIVWSWSNVEIEPHSVLLHKNTNTWWEVANDKVERTDNEECCLYIHNLEINGAIELLNARDLTDCGFNDNTYDVNQFITRLFRLSNFEYTLVFGSGVDINFLNKKVDFIKTFENYTLLSALREFLDAYNMCPKLTFSYTEYPDGQYTLLYAVLSIVAKTGDYSLPTHYDGDFTDIKEIRTMSKESFGTCVVSNAENVISSKHKTYPATGSVRLGSTKNLIVEGTTLNDGIIRLPSKVYKGNWIKIIYPLKVTLTISGSVTHTFTYTYERTEISFEKMTNYFANKILTDTASQAIVNTFLSYFDNEIIKEKCYLMSSITLYDGNKLVSYYGANNDQEGETIIKKGDDVPYLAELFFGDTAKPVVFTDKNTKGMLKDIKQGICWERGSNIISGFDMFSGGAKLDVRYTDYGGLKYDGDRNIVSFTQSGIQILVSIAGQRLKYVYTGSKSLATQLSKISFIIDYIPMADLKVKVDNTRDKNDIQLYNQNGKITDNVALSKLINSYSKEISSDTITKYRQDYSFSACPKVGSIVYIGKDPYVINNVSLDFALNEDNGEMGYFINGEYTMSKYVSTKSLMVNPNTNIRDYSIPQNFNVKRKQLYRDYYELSYSVFEDANQDTSYFDWQNVFLFATQTHEIGDFISIIKLTYDNAIGGDEDTGASASNSWYYQLETTQYTLDKMLYVVLDFDDNNIIGYGSQNVFSGFDITRIFNDLTDTLNTPISYVDNNGKFKDIDLLLCSKEQLANIYDDYKDQQPATNWEGMLYNYSVFIPEEIYNGALSSHEIRITENNYRKDAIEVPVFEYVCQIDDSEDILIGDNILSQHENCLYFYSATIGSANQHFNQNNVANGNTLTETQSPVGWEINLGVSIGTATIDGNKILTLRLYDSMRYDVNSASFSYGNSTNIPSGRDIAIYRTALDTTTGKIVANDLLFIFKQVPSDNINGNLMSVFINHYKLN